VVSYKLFNGFVIRGEGSPANFDMEIGRKYAREDVENQLWKLEGYRLQWNIYPLFQKRGAVNTVCDTDIV
jgi:hypothetical protein